MEGTHVEGVTAEGTHVEGVTDESAHIEGTHGDDEELKAHAEGTQVAGADVCVLLAFDTPC